jgi:hypothetical protein
MYIIPILIAYSFFFVPFIISDVRIQHFPSNVTTKVTHIHVGLVSHAGCKAKSHLISAAAVSSGVVVSLRPSNLHLLVLLMSQVCSMNLNMSEEYHVSTLSYMCVLYIGIPNLGMSFNHCIAFRQEYNDEHNKRAFSSFSIAIIFIEYQNVGKLTTIEMPK